ncbi:MoaD/ThiS family protein [Corynebacterium caspium]|uniref:MoaD/ThiS family protein n=1 Tax=Corynebacterium caspium TaxID=234828 RepID=UPI00037267BA|nr:MoaD/ThiS family protein [Corynebacterium caspium]WKD59474.1 ThiS family protein [Corynebacterium caspium DSM 44850]
MQVHYFAAARAAAGTDQEFLDNPPATLGELLEMLATTHPGTTAAGMHLAEIFKRCSFLIDGMRQNAPETSLAGVARVDILPPFAGG